MRGCARVFSAGNDAQRNECEMLLASAWLPLDGALLPVQDECQGIPLTLRQRVEHAWTSPGNVHTLTCDGWVRRQRKSAWW